MPSFRVLSRVVPLYVNNVVCFSMRISPTIRALKVGSSIVARKAKAVTGPTPGTVIRRWQIGSALAAISRRASASAMFWG